MLLKIINQGPINKEGEVIIDYGNSLNKKFP